MLSSTRPLLRRPGVLFLQLRPSAAKLHGPEAKLADPKGKSRLGNLDHIQGAALRSLEVILAATDDRVSQESSSLFCYP